MAEMTFAEALDQVRSWDTKFLKPLAKLRDVLETARMLEQSVEQLRTESTAIHQDILRLKNEAQEASATTAALQERAAGWRVQADQVQEQVETAQRVARDQIAAAERWAAERRDELDREHAASRQQVESEIAAYRASLSSDIAALEDKKRDLEQAIAALKARF